jgi:hypothetical protein
MNSYTEYILTHNIATLSKRLLQFRSDWKHLIRFAPSLLAGPHPILCMLLRGCCSADLKQAFFESVQSVPMLGLFLTHISVTHRKVGFLGP